MSSCRSLNVIDSVEAGGDMSSKAAPDGFMPHFKTSPVTAPWEPLLSRRGERSVEIGMWLREAHCNSRGFLHGGVIAALADNAMGLSCVTCHPGMKGALTVSLNVDYVGSAKLGQWLRIEPRVLKVGGTLGFADALITADGDPIARASATFRMYS
jgi:uncharacterized protein (TIGR00369 family)